MLNMFLLTLLMILCVFGIYFLVKEITSVFLKCRAHSRVILEISDSADFAEDTIRSALSANPESEIVIVDKCENDEMRTIIEKFSDDNSRLHIKRPDKMSKTVPEK